MWNPSRKRKEQNKNNTTRINFEDDYQPKLQTLKTLSNTIAVRRQSLPKTDTFLCEPNHTANQLKPRKHLLHNRKSQNTNKNTAKRNCLSNDRGMFQQHKRSRRRNEPEGKAQFSRTRESDRYRYISNNIFINVTSLQFNMCMLLTSKKPKQATTTKKCYNKMSFLKCPYHFPCLRIIKTIVLESGFDLK